MKTLSLAVAALVAFSGCGPSALDEFRAASPSSQGLEVKLPSAVKQGLGGTPALMPGVTSAATLVVNGGVGLTLLVLAGIISEPPSSLTEEQAVWGPLTKPLWADTYRFTVTRKADGFHSLLEGRAKSGTDADFKPVLVGVHAPSLSRAQGSFTLTAKDGGRAEVTYARAADHALNLQVGFRGPLGDSDYAYSEAADASGSFSFVTASDFDTRTPALERLAVTTTWLASGTGRSDVVVTGSATRFTECWDSALLRTYYEDTLALFPTEGAAGACPLQAAETP
jgi:hypothetical protein